MELISYGELAKMRLDDFLGDSAEIYVEESGMIGIVGLGGFQQYDETYFGWKQGEPYRTAGVVLDLGPESILPDDAAKRIIEKLRLPLYKGMTTAELVEAFGEPQTDGKGAPGTRFMRFNCGDGDLYRLGCQVDDKHGLIHLFLARKDYCDEDDSL